MDQDNSDKKFLVNMSILPTELLAYIISFLSSLRDRVKLRYVSRGLRCVIEGTPSPWKKFEWPYYDSRDECRVKEVLKVCGQHIKVLFFPYSRVPLTLVEMLQYCSNVQHLSLPTTKLDPEQLINTIHHMGCLQTLELKMDNNSDIQSLLLNVGHLRELTIRHYHYADIIDVFKHWVELQLRPPRFNFITSVHSRTSKYFIDYASQIATIPTGITTNFRVYKICCEEVLNFSSTLPHFQLQIEGSGQVTTPCVKLSDFDILGLNNDIAMMTDCQYGGRTMYMVRYQTDDNMLSNFNSMHITRWDNLSCITHFDFSGCLLLHSGHLEQLAITCPNLQRLCLQACSHCLESLQGLHAIASYCHNLQRLNLFGVHVTKVEDHMLLWEILSDMKLTHLEVEFCVLRPKAVNKKS